MIKAEINYDGRYKDTLIVSADSLEELKIEIQNEIEKRFWNRENCYIHIVRS